VFGYELLFREGLEACFAASDLEAACRSTLDSSLLMGLDVLCGGSYAFVNCTREALLKGHARVLPPQSTVIEVLESVVPDGEIEQACRALRSAGYLIALDDFVPDDARASLVPVADFIKLDLIGTPRNQWQSMVTRYSPQVRMLAEKVETRGDFVATRSMGFTYFQGFFFAKPTTLSATDIPPNQVNYVRMLHAVHQPAIDFRRLEALIKQEASLCYRLLRYLNSALFNFAREIRSIRHALSMLGENEIRRWISLAATVGAGQQRPEELLQTALVRAHFCELVSGQWQRGETDYFLLGLLSLLDAILGVSMATLLAGLPIDREIKAALLGAPSQLRPLYDLVLAHENADWVKCSEIANRFHIPEQKIAEAYLESVRWAREVVGSR
jgi:EAL and modified HD-GYP domain-containing signal transduction protein